MEYFEILILALVQGITEFLPISSSAHLILAPKIFGYEDHSLAFDVAVHIGSLGAVVWYFRCEVRSILSAMFRQAHNETAAAERKLGWLIIYSTIPIAITGLIFKSFIESDMRTTFVIAITTIGFGALLLGADYVSRRHRGIESINWKDALIIGLFQALALIPGTSRSGITITAGLLLGLTREAASKYSFLLSIPTIIMSGGLVVVDIILSDVRINTIELMFGAILSFVSAYACIHLFLKFVEKIGMVPFVVYRFILGAVLLMYAL